MYSKKSPSILALIGLLFAAALFTTGCDESSSDDAAEKAAQSETTEAATSTEPVEVTTEVEISAPVVEVSENELIAIDG